VVFHLSGTFLAVNVRRKKIVGGKEKIV